MWNNMIVRINSLYNSVFYYSISQSPHKQLGTITGLAKWFWIFPPDGNPNICNQQMNDKLKWTK